MIVVQKEAAEGGMMFNHIPKCNASLADNN